MRRTASRSESSPSPASRWFRGRGQRILVSFATLGIAAALLLSGSPRPGGAEDSSMPHGAHGGNAMTEQAMKAQLQAWWASHPRVGGSTEGPAAAAAATFSVKDFIFDLDANTNTKVDTAKIGVGEIVNWQWINGSHTITSGTGPSDPNAGALFNQPADVANPHFSFQFNNPGTFPFFCSPHAFANMRGVVIVSPPTGVGAAGERALGFAGELVPNPTGAGTRFRFALRTAGRARAEVFDAAGRRVAVVLDRELEPGVYTGAWDGRAGRRIADTGVYYLRLSVPGFVGSRAIVVRR